MSSSKKKESSEEDEVESSEDEVEIDENATEENLQEIARHLSRTLKKIVTDLADFTYTAKTLSRVKMCLEAAIDLTEESRNILKND